MQNLVSITIDENVFSWQLFNKNNNKDGVFAARHGSGHVKARNVLGTLIKKQKPGPAGHGTKKVGTAREHGTAF